MAVMLMSRQSLPQLDTISIMDGYLSWPPSSSASAAAVGGIGQGMSSSSILAVPTLAPIPGSAAATPITQSMNPSPDDSPNSTGPQHDRTSDQQQHFYTPEETMASCSSSRSASASHMPVAGSYFPSVSTYTPKTPAPPCASGSGGTPTTPVDRGRLTPLEIPPGTPDEPLFSAYPDVAGKGKGRLLHQPSTSSFTLQAPKPRRRQVVPVVAPQIVMSQQRRRRASTFSHAPSPLNDVQLVRRRSSQSRSPPQRSSSSSGLMRRRRASVGSRNDPPPSWPSMPSEEARRQNALTLPFSYQAPAEVDFTLQSVSTVATVRPLASPAPPPDPPDHAHVDKMHPISPRRSSLSGLPLSDLPADAVPYAVGTITADMTMPHDPPRRRSSLDLGSSRREVALPDTDDADTASTGQSEMFSPASSHNQLSSAKTSLSRSAKSGQEGGGHKDPSLSAVKLQRSLEWEAKQGQHRIGAEKRKMILLELVETEVAYADDLKMLVQVYLPQLYALPGVSDRSAGLVARNASELLDFHAQLSSQMADVLRDEGVGYEPDADVDRVDRAAEMVCNLLLQNATSFSLYNDYCAGSVAAGTLVRQIAARTEYDSYERRCQFIGGSQAHKTLKHLLDDTAPSPEPTNRNRLQFKDYLIMPIQRVCRYPLLLSQLVDRTAEFGLDTNEASIVEQALATMRLVAEGADEARRKREAEIMSATIRNRLEFHPIIDLPFLQSLGTCRLVGALDVLHHHPTLAPLIPPVRVKYLAAFLYRGYLILAKVKRKTYEPKHYLPLEVFELIDITEGFLPHSIRLSLREHNFDLAASCEAEKAVWAEALVAARDESLVPPFELPASVSPFAATRTRRSSQVILSQTSSPTTETVSLGGGLLSGSLQNKRHTMAIPPEPVSSPESPTTQLTFGDRTLLLKRATNAQRTMVDRGLADVFSEACAQARSRAQMHHELFTPADTDVSLRRNRSFLESRPFSSITFSGEVRGAIMPVGPMVAAAAATTERKHRSYSGDSADQSEAETNEFGILRGRSYTQLPNSTHTSPAPSRKTSFSSLRAKASNNNASSSPVRLLPPFDRRKTTTTFHSYAPSVHRPNVPSRAKSTPVSPIMSPAGEHPPHLHLDVSGSGNSSPDDGGSPARCAIYTSGRGLGNVPYKPDSPTVSASSAWGTLKRSMSLARLRSSPGTDPARLSTSCSSVGDPSATATALTASPVDSPHHSPAAPLSQPLPPLDRRSSSGGGGGGGALGLSDKGAAIDLGSDEKLAVTPASATAPATVGAARPAGTIRRKRSVRILERLSRFTPM